MLDQVRSGLGWIPFKAQASHHQCMDINVITKVPIVNIAATDAVRLASGIASHHPKLDGVTHAFRWFRSDGMAETPQDGTQKIVIRRYTSKQMGQKAQRRENAR